MKNNFLKVLASVMAVASLSVCSVSNFASAANEQPNELSISNDDGASARSYHTYNLAGTGKVRVETITGPTTVTIYADPDGGTVSVYYKKQGTSNFVFVRSFDPSGNTPSASLTVPSGFYDIYVSAPYATSTNRVTGFINIY